MANPQPDQYTKFSNELFEAYIHIARFLSPYENAVWLCIFRQTYGYNQKNKWVSLSQIEKMTDIRQPHVVRTKKKLALKNMIITNGGVGIQKDYEQWNIPKQVYPNRYNTTKDIPKQALPKQVRIITQTGNKGLPKQVDIKENVKDNIKDNNTHIEVLTNFETIWLRYPNKDGRKAAERHFHASVKKPQDWQDINTALDNYLRDDKVLRGYIKMGSTWFNNWRDWIAGPLTPPKRTAAQAHNISSLVKFREEHKDDKPSIREGIHNPGDSLPGPKV